MADAMVVNCGGHLQVDSHDLHVIGCHTVRGSAVSVPEGVRGTSATPSPSWMSVRDEDAQTSRDDRPQRRSQQFIESDKTGGRCTTDTKQKQREKNRVAAARSRGKKRDRVEQLSKEAAELEEHYFKLRDEIRQLKREKNQLSLTLSIHQLKCPHKDTIDTWPELPGSS